MESSLVVLGLLLVLVLISLGLDTHQCTLLSKSGMALLVGVLCGLAIAADEELYARLDFRYSVFFDILLPPIIYEAGFSVQRLAFFHNVGAILSTAILGTLISATVTGLLLFAAGQAACIPEIEWIEAFLFGALVSAVDPVATLACFNKLHVPPLLFNIVFGESVLNDAVAIALYQSLLRYHSAGDVSALVLLQVLVQTFSILLGSIAISLVLTLFAAFCFVRTTSLRAFPVYEVLVCFIVALATYFAADTCAMSGIVSLFFAGMLTAHYMCPAMSVPGQTFFHHALEAAAFVCESLVYVFMGVSASLCFVQVADAERIHHTDVDWAFVAWTCGVLLLGRALNTFPLLLVANRYRVPSERVTLPMMVVIWFTGLRGAVSFALVTTWSYVDSNGTSHRKLMITTTLFVVMATTWLIGGATGPLVRGLQLAQCRQSHGERLAITPECDRHEPVAKLAVRQRSLSQTTSLEHQPSRAEEREVGAPSVRRLQAVFALWIDRWRAFDETHLMPLFGRAHQPVAVAQPASIAPQSVDPIEEDLQATEPTAPMAGSVSYE
ncbi:Monovalent Cation:Proton Antiporter-1 (CPA1) Family [Achlya hypogyna]|uniref:Sodium/hydrogen exchanger n=1 Tax=Achlya hypogyna TaxID=1202772 RepID=A0A1V9YAQ4_ACHHY|nr:Monovalent Cation:Proton Antiporter-1 (CPA1) Family [Achlya hypogyna]